MEKEKRRDSEKRHRHKEKDYHRDKDRRHRDERYDDRNDRWDREPRDRSRDHSRRSSRSRVEERGAAEKRAPEQHQEEENARKESKRKRDPGADASEKSKRNRSEEQSQVPPAAEAIPAAIEADKPPSENPAPALTEIEKAKRLLKLKKDLDEKFKKLPQLNKPPPPASAPPAPPSLNEYVPNQANIDAVKRAQECVARLGFEQPPGTAFHIPVPGTPAPAAASKKVTAPVLRLDAQGREIDDKGVVVDRRANISTLKVNINKQKKEAFQILHPELEEDPINNPHFDPSMGIDRNKLVRSKRSSIQFVEQGRFTKKAEIMRLNTRFGAAKAREIRSKQAALAKAKAEGDINPNLIEVTERIFKDEKHKEPIPSMEWWDYAVLPTEAQSYDEIYEDSKLKFKKDKINIYVEHPVPIEPPAEPPQPPPQPLKLTKKEQKKMRTQRRLAREKERQELIRQGKIEAPKGKVKMSNLMNVLASEATQDPTRLEMELRTAAAERERAHTDRNLARKLTPAERREKKEKRLFDDPGTLETIVSVFRVKDISNPKNRFKVDVNAAHNKLTGCAIITDGMTVVIVEGCTKSIKRYSKLMLRRIDWSAKEEGDEAAGGDEGDDDAGDGEVNKCVQVWQGSVARPAFDKFFLQKFHTAGAARKYLADAGVGHYWDCALHYKEQ